MGRTGGVSKILIGQMCWKRNERQMSVDHDNGQARSRESIPGLGMFSVLGLLATTNKAGHHHFSLSGVYGF